MAIVDGEPAGYFAERRGSLRLSWGDAEESLRPTQIGAAWAAAAHLMVDAAPAQIVMPTGSGKTAVTTLLPFLVGARRVLVIAPGRFVRDQLRDEFVALRRLKLGHVLADADPPPTVRMIDGELKDASSWEALRDCEVVVSTPRTVSSVHTGVAAAPPDLFDLILFDEGHHVPAETWRHVLGQFPQAGAILLTATPFRRDLKALPGKIVFWYPLRQAIADGVYRPVTFLPVSAPRPDDRDAVLAKAASERIKSAEHQAAGSRLLIRARYVKELDGLVQLYGTHGVGLGKVTGDTPLAHAKKIFAKVADGELLGIACVGVLGEGFDMPAMRIAVYHDRHKSLPATLQFVGRVARPTGPDIAPELIATKEDVADETGQLYGEDASWAELLPAIADAAVQEEHERREYLTDFSGPMAEDISRYALHPERQAQVFERAPGSVAPNLRVEPATVGNGRVIWSETDGDGELLVVITAQQVHPRWYASSKLDYVEHRLHLASAQADGRIVFISSDTPGAAEDLLQMIGADDAVIVAPDRLNKILTALDPTSYSAVGVRSAIAPGGRQPSYKTMSGAAVQRAFSVTDRYGFMLGHVIGKHQGPRGTDHIGISASSGKVWQLGGQHLLGYRNWCRQMATLLLQGSLTRDVPLLQVTTGQRLTDFPGATVVAVDLDERLLDSPLFIRSGPTLVPLREAYAQIEAVNPDVATIALWHDDVRMGAVAFGTSGRVISGAADSPELIDSESGEILDLGDVLAAYPPTVYFADGTSVRGRQLFSPPDDLPGVDASWLVTGDWSGVDIQAEVAVKDHSLVTVQERSWQWLAAGSPEAFVVGDHGKGELADFLLIDPGATVRLTLVHCKKSGGPQPGLRVGDLHEIVGQTVRSTQIGVAGTIWRELLRRLKDRKATTLIRGDLDELNRLLAAWTERAPALSAQVVLVQPGLKLEALDSASGAPCRILLLNCENWVSSRGWAFKVVGS